jgi:hypothetical protein
MGCARAAQREPKRKVDKPCRHCQRRRLQHRANVGAGHISACRCRSWSPVRSAEAPGRPIKPAPSVARTAAAMCWPSEKAAGGHGSKSDLSGTRAILRLTMRRGLLLLLVPVSLMMAAAAAITYFVWWDATHCTFCRTRLDDYGRCPNPDCHLGRLTREQDAARIS